MTLQILALAIGLAGIVGFSIPRRSSTAPSTRHAPPLPQPRQWRVPQPR